MSFFALFFTLFDGNVKKMRISLCFIAFKRHLLYEPRKIVYRSRRRFEHRILARMLFSFSYLHQNSSPFELIFRQIIIFTRLTSTIVYVKISHKGRCINNEKVVSYFDDNFDDFDSRRRGRRRIVGRKYKSAFCGNTEYNDAFVLYFDEKTIGR